MTATSKVAKPAKSNAPLTAAEVSQRLLSAEVQFVTADANWEEAKRQLTAAYTELEKASREIASARGDFAAVVLGGAAISQSVVYPPYPLELDLVGQTYKIVESWAA